MSVFYEHKGTNVHAQKQNGLSFYPHFHTHIEIVYVLEGKSVAFADYKEVLLEKGDIFIAFPNQIHNYNDIEPLKCLITIFPGDLCPDFCTVMDSFIPETPLIKNGSFSKNILPTFKALIASNNSESTYHNAVTKGYCAVLLGKIFESITLKKTEQSNLDTVRHILSYCADNYKKELSLDILANDLHINKFHISHLFGQKMKIKFNDFINSLRINDACNRLRNNDSTITEIAFQVGFNSIRSFNRAFHQQTGVTPREYRNL